MHNLDFDSGKLQNLDVYKMCILVCKVSAEKASFPRSRFLAELLARPSGKLSTTIIHQKPQLFHKLFNCLLSIEGFLNFINLFSDGDI